MPQTTAIPGRGLSGDRNLRERPNLADIDVFRGFAAFIVLAMHTREIMWVGLRDFWKLHSGLHASPDAFLTYLTFPLMWGTLGVPIFFVLSGYCIHRSQAFARARTGSYNLAAPNFLMRRFLRIYPVLVGALILTLACDWASRHFAPDNWRLGDDGPGAFLVNLFSLQGIAGGISGQGIAGGYYGTNSPLWTLALEVQFYAVYPLLTAAMLRLGSFRTLLALIALNVMSYWALERNNYIVFSSYYVSWYLGALVAEGEASGLLAERLASRGRRAQFYGLAFIVMCGGCAVFLRDRYIGIQIWAIAFAIFLFAVLRRPEPFRALTARAFRSLGLFSFSLYIVHRPIVVLIHSFFFHAVRQVSLAPAGATLVGAGVAAYAFSLVFEKPALAMSQKLKRKASFVPPTLLATP